MATRAELHAEIARLKVIEAEAKADHAKIEAKAIKMRDEFAEVVKENNILHQNNHLQKVEIDRLTEKLVKAGVDAVAAKKKTPKKTPKKAPKKAAKRAAKKATGVLAHIEPVNSAYRKPKAAKKTTKKTTKATSERADALVISLQRGSDTALERLLTLNFS